MHVLSAAATPAASALSFQAQATVREAGGPTSLAAKVGAAAAYIAAQISMLSVSMTSRDAGSGSGSGSGSGLPITT